MKNFLKISLALIVVLSLMTACLTSKVVTQATPTSPAITNTVVNQANLLLDSLVLQNAVALGLPPVIQKDKSIVPALKDADLALGFVVNGGTSNSLNQVLATLGQSSNTNLFNAITPLIGVLNSTEVTLKNKYGTNVGGQITLALTTAFYNGLTTALVGQ